MGRTGVNALTSILAPQICEKTSGDRTVETDDQAPFYSIHPRACAAYGMIDLADPRRNAGDEVMSGLGGVIKVQVLSDCGDMFDGAHLTAKVTPVSSSETAHNRRWTVRS